MAETVDREALLKVLEDVACGLAPRENLVEQGTCVAFMDGKVYTYNDEVFANAPTGFSKNFTCAVQADRLLNSLKKMPDREIRLEIKGAEIRLLGKNKGADLICEKNIELPLSTIETPEEWLTLPEGYCDAVNIVRQAGKGNDPQLLRSCVHFHPKWIEAGDDHQFCRWRIKTGIKNSALVRCDSVKYTYSLEVTEFAEGESWLHFRNSSGVQISCRRYLEEYPTEEITEIISVTGEPITLSKGLKEILPFIEYFSSEHKDANYALVNIKAGRIRVDGIGITGKSWAKKVIKWDGPDMSFLIAPTLLEELINRHSDFQLAPGRLKVEQGPMKFVACLGVAKKEEAEEAITEGIDNE